MTPEPTVDLTPNPPKPKPKRPRGGVKKPAAERGLKLPTGNQLKKERLRQGYSQKQLATLAGISVTAVSLIESPGNETSREKMARALRMDIRKD